MAEVVATVVGVVLGWIAGKLNETSRREHEFGVRFDSERRQVYAAFIGGLRSLFMNSSNLMTTADGDEAANARRDLHQELQSVLIRHGEVALVAGWPVREAANGSADLAIKVSWGAIKLRTETAATPETLPAEFRRWGDEIDLAEREFIEAARKELRILSEWAGGMSHPRWQLWRRR